MNGGSGTLSNSTSNNNVVGGAVGSGGSSSGGDFNQYQLDSGDLTQTTNGSLSADEGSHDSAAASPPPPNLVHSSSANNLQLLQSSSSSIHNVQTNPATNSNNAAQKPNAISTSKSINSFSLSSPSPTVEHVGFEHQFSQQLQLQGKDEKSNSVVTKFMKQSLDKISEREQLTDRVSIGCQTISTGDITVTNVYIE